MYELVLRVVGYNFLINLSFFYGGGDEVRCLEVMGDLNERMDLSKGKRLKCNIKSIA